MSIYFVLAAMLFCHVIDDYVLQAPCLCNLKQKSFWKKNAPEKQYKYDYIVALIMHALSWSFMIMLPLAIAVNFKVNFVFFTVFIINALFHAIVDDLKANKKIINLWADQFAHFVQIILTIAFYVHGDFVC
jgi:hypothetical protein